MKILILGTGCYNCLNLEMRVPACWVSWAYPKSS
jgi:hypothetical protein